MLKALDCAEVDRPPVWIMRQAGRYLPEYRAMKQQHSFGELVKTPELAVEVSLQPLRRFALDAAIIFSDILTVPEAMGLPYTFRDGGGIELAWRVDSSEHIQALEFSEDVLRERLAYVGEAVGLLRREIGDTRALLGFAGSPWTLACYMVCGGSSADFGLARRMWNEAPAVFESLLEALTSAVVLLCRMQLDAGADAVQLFDSHAAACSDLEYPSCSLRWISQIVRELGPDVPVILYAKGVGHRGAELLGTGATALSLDASVSLPAFAKRHPGHYALQGNLDQRLLTGDTEPVAEAARDLLESMRGRLGHIFNLGHGITPDARIDAVETMVETVRQFR